MKPTIKGLFLILLLISGSSLAYNEDEVISKIAELDWKEGPGTYVLGSTQASVTTWSGTYITQGKDAHEYMKLTEGHDQFKPDAVVVFAEGPAMNTSILYEHHDVGYIEMDDWDVIDSDNILKVIKENTAKANRNRQPGYPKMYVDGWIEKPHLNRAAATVYWAIKGRSDSGLMVVNSKALKLGRNGFSSITWMGEPRQFLSAENTLNPILDNYQYEKGMTYADFTTGDNIAAFGIGALAYKMMTGKTTAKTAGAGIMAALLIFAKKLWFLIFIPFIMFWGWIKKALFGPKP